MQAKRMCALLFGKEKRGCIVHVIVLPTVHICVCVSVQCCLLRMLIGGQSINPCSICVSRKRFTLCSSFIYLDLESFYYTFTYIHLSVSTKAKLHKITIEILNVLLLLLLLL